MRPFDLFAAGITIVVLTAFAGCSKSNPAQNTTKNVTGNLTGINTPAQPGPDVVTIQTPIGPESYVITTNTVYSVNGRYCTVEEFAALLAANQTRNCTIVYDITGAVDVIAAGNTSTPN